ncbi:hypothetical protein E3N88_21550 [Mikania micrantha]|uniref:Uncharacterized protein n=1 Tax=Mikania micrantha TaxID=192012 RepID=A0A5N6N8U7_9ASTR|nr:hypothetical protein E3N88_21550 [Mikania micrantha]
MKMAIPIIKSEEQISSFHLNLFLSRSFRFPSRQKTPFSPAVSGDQWNRQEQYRGRKSKSSSTDLPRATTIVIIFFFSGDRYGDDRQPEVIRFLQLVGLYLLLPCHHHRGIPSPPV